MSPTPESQQALSLEQVIEGISAQAKYPRRMADRPLYESALHYLKRATPVSESHAALAEKTKEEVHLAASECVELVCRMLDMAPRTTWEDPFFGSHKDQVKWRLFYRQADARVRDRIALLIAKLIEGKR